MHFNLLVYAVLPAFAGLPTFRRIFVNEISHEHILFGLNKLSEVPCVLERKVSIELFD